MYPFILPPPGVKNASVLHPGQPFVFVRLLNFCSSCRKWLFLISIHHSCFLFSQMVVHIFSLFFYEFSVFYLLICRNTIYSGNSTDANYMYCKPFHHFVAFYSPTVYLINSNSNFNMVIIINHFP